MFLLQFFKLLYLYFKKRGISLSHIQAWGLPMNFGCVRFLIGFQWPLEKGTKVRISEPQQDNLGNRWFETSSVNAEVKHSRYLGGNQNSHYLDMVFIFNPLTSSFHLPFQCTALAMSSSTVSLYWTHKELLLTEWKKTLFRHVTLKVNHSQTRRFPFACIDVSFLCVLLQWCVSVHTHTSVPALLFSLHRRNTGSMKYPVWL